MCLLRQSEQTRQSEYLNDRSRNSLTDYRAEKYILLNSWMCTTSTHMFDRFCPQVNGKSECAGCYWMKYLYGNYNAGGIVKYFEYVADFIFIFMNKGLFFLTNL